MPRSRARAGRHWRSRFWQASDEAALTRHFKERGNRLTVEVTGRSRSRTGQPGSTTARGTQFWLEIVPVGESSEGAGRLAVSHAEYEAARPGAHLEVWRLGSRYELDRVVIRHRSPAVGTIILAVGAVLLLIGPGLLVVSVRRYRRTVALDGGG